MTHPPYRLARRVGAAPDAVLAAIRDAAVAMPRRNLPPRLQRGVRGVGATLRGPRFTVALRRTDEGDFATELVGMVVPLHDGGCEVRASVLDRRGAPATGLALLGAAGALALSGATAPAWMAAGLAALVLLPAAFRDATGLMDHGEAAFLLQWLNAVLDPLDAAGADRDDDASPPAAPRP